MECANEKLSNFLDRQGICDTPTPKFVGVYDRWKMPAMANERVAIHLLDEGWRPLYTMECYELTVDALLQFKTRRVRYVLAIERPDRVVAYYPKGLRGFPVSMVERLWRQSQNMLH